MNSLNFLDTNVWLALVWETAYPFRSGAGMVYGARGRAVSFLPVHPTRSAPAAYQPGRNGQRREEHGGAWEVYDQCCTDERIAFLQEPDSVDLTLRALAGGRHSSPNVWADAYLAAFATAAGLRLVTFDKALAAKSIECLVSNDPLASRYGSIPSLRAVLTRAVTRRSTCFSVCAAVQEMRSRFCAAATRVS
jgi:hypothetical protein